jgi:hypothetical protein
MPSAIEQVVNIYVSLGSRQRLEAMRRERQQAMLELRNHSLSAPTPQQLEDEIAVIDAGLQKLPPY